ncbi:protein phosphatase 2C domain-containing protein [Streptomyces sp. NBC_01216]|uniref:PP2C family protein-serine/threonine phosphatase n=1 Tax=unclassified Streptomyces TaxID=2593676 RepID=UPI002E0FD2BA|nr:protein phosphatase 2C domain-containing protein [Streptomyces sp. NBC_01216]
MPYTAVTALSHAGLVREHNEDSLVVGPWTLCGTVTENPQTFLFPLGTPLVVAVADGLGGHPAGEVASGLVVRRLAGPAAWPVSAEGVRHAMNDCNRAVYEAASGEPGRATMGTTVAGAVVLPDALLVFNVGDSRVYAAGAGPLRRLSVDDSPPSEPGHTTSLVTQTLGGGRVFSAVDPHVRRHPSTVGDRFLVCSDGLTDPVPDEVLDRLLRSHDDSRAAFELWKAAIEAGGPDNITLALIRIGA